MNKKLLITGASGFLGGYLLRRALEQGHEVHGVAFTSPIRQESVREHSVNLSNPQAVHQLFQIVKPDAVIHAAALAHPSICEKNAQASFVSNVLASMHIVRSARRFKCPLIYTSSEQVFSGQAGVYRTDDRTNPINIYGAHKAQVERHVARFLPRAFIARLPLMYSLAKTDRCFARAMVDALNKGETLNAFVDEVRPPAHVNDVASALIALVQLVTHDRSGARIFHFGGPQALNRYEMATQLATAIGAPLRLINSLSQNDVDTGVRRPSRLWLDSTASWRTVNIQPRTWISALNEMN